tara:strand:+ start:422 stop:592 length:171 start_codon:yes stop_codon:yes gene_type:complete
MSRRGSIGKLFFVSDIAFSFEFAAFFNIVILPIGDGVQAFQSQVLLHIMTTNTRKN